MEEIDYGKLIKMVETSVKSSFEAYIVKGKIVPNVANLGGKRGDIAKLERKGEYYGISVELLEDLKPLLTDRFVIKLLTFLKKQDYVTVLSLLGLTTIEQLQYILHTWFNIAVVDYDNEFKIGLKKSYPVFDDWIRSVTHDPLLGRFKIVEVGYNMNTSQPVVPIDWLDREFANGRALHREMDKLESRIGKPPVTFAVIYSMIIQKKESLIKEVSKSEYNKIFYLELKNSSMASEFVTKVKKGDYSYVTYGNLLIGFKLNDILEEKKNTVNINPKLREVGVLVSRLQKAVRRGRYASKALAETIDSLNNSPNYNLPEHNFLRVSASKQMVWRLFITILEDCRPYQPINELSLLDLILLVLVTQKVQEYKFKKPILDLIKLTALLAQYNDTTSDWNDWYKQEPAEKTPLAGNSDFHNAISLALSNVIMMSGDNYMLRKYYSEDNLFEPFLAPEELMGGKWKQTLEKKNYVFHDPKVYEDVVLSSYDMHNKPHIILYFQSCIPISLTTKQISGYIWDRSSGYNVRSGKKKSNPDPILRAIQKYLYEETQSLKTETTEKPIIREPKKIKKDYTIKKQEPDKNAKRTSFLVLFGRKYRYKGKEVIIAGTKETPARIKIDNEWTYHNDIDVLNTYPQKTIILKDIDPPFGFRWTKDRMDTKIIKGRPLVNGKPVPYFDGSSLLESVTPDINKTVDKSIYKIMIEIFAGLDTSFSTLQMLRKKYTSEIVNWLPKNSDMKSINMDLVQLAYTKLFNNFNNLIMIGPVDRSGSKMQNSINYLLEGKLWAVFNLFSYLYPDTIKPSGNLNFNLNKETAGFVHLVGSLKNLLFSKKTITGTVPVIKTELWDHQKDSVNRILAGFNEGRHGFGDASDVGSGKTLTSLKIAAELIKKNDSTYWGILVLLPGNKLIKTWDDELKKHTEGFDVKFQDNKTEIGPIKRNTIVVTTIARARDHPINHKWLLVVIDECLTVQNRNALQTESAWKQSLMSKHLVMMSATFFRTRFDKLYYMLKMLQTGLPERREYLDTILLESIVSKISSVKRNWTSHFNYFELDEDSRRRYDEIDRLDISIELKFAKLNSFLVSNTKANLTVTKQLGKLVKRMEKKGHRCLIYGRAKDEVELWSRELGIPIYPEKGTHCVVTYHDGTYGLNDLVIYDTIVMRPPVPDLLPQIKGRIDRPGQKLDKLYIEYFVLKNTIEEGLILRLNIASNFVQNYIMPLSKFYDISVHHKKYIEKEEENEDI